MNMTGGEAVVAALKAIGVRHVFGIVSVHNLPIYDAIDRDGSITAVAVRHEQGAAHAADGYSRATGELGVAITSTGPGTANAMNGLFEAGFASSRVLLVTGQIESRYYGKGKGFLHEAERQLAMLQSVTRRAESVRRTEDIAAAVVRVATDINTGRPQPGAVEIPIDLQYAHADVEVPTVGAWPVVTPPEDVLQRAAELLGGAQRPVIWAGGGVTRAGANSALVALAERLPAPVVTTIEGRGAIPEDHDLALGATTTARTVAQLIEEADVLLAVGTRFQGSATRNWQLPITGQLIHLDADPAVIGRNYQPAVPIVGDARVGLERLAALLGHTAVDVDFVDRARVARDEARARSREMIGADYEAIMDTIRDLLPRDANIVRDATVPAYLWGDRLLPIYEPGTSIRPASAAIGPGLPLAIGAAIGSGHRSVLIQGDGGFMLNLGELATAVQYSVPLTICVFNDGGYGVLRGIQARSFEGRTTGVDLATPDFATVAQGIGMTGLPVKTVEEFRDAFKQAADADGPVLLDIDMSALQPMGGLGARPQPRA